MSEGARLVVGDCLDAIADLPDASVDAVVSDPPYELGFMGKAWDGSGIAYNIDLWRDVLRVLKPGGHLLAFGGTRTYHRLACAIEDAGFEIRDSIHWVYGSGFPKSLDVSKAIDKAAGAEREVVGNREVWGRGVDRFSDIGEDVPVEGNAVIPVTAPATDDAARWQGWGTALKPAHEPIVVARKPLAGTVAQTVLAYGTGALNINATRVGFQSEADERESKDKNRHADFGTEPGGNAVYGDYSMIPRTNYAATGRWSPNFLLTHAEGCEEVGTREEAVAVHDAPAGTLAGGEQDRGSVREDDGSITYRGRTISVPVWNCVEGCPVREMDAQSGTSRSQVRPPTGRDSRGEPGYRMRFTDTEQRGHNDTGGASRFFPAFRYQAKASRRERNAGLEGMPQGDRVFFGSGGRTLVDGAWVETHSEPRPRANTHPTVKPVELMRWLCRLVTPPGGVVLDPFTGSGTTGVAAVLEGFDFIGIEREPEYAEIAERRIAHAKAQVETAPAQLAL